MPDKEVESYTPKKQRDLWLKEFVPRLGATMGAMYRNAVEGSLIGEFEDEFDSISKGNNALMLFQAMIVEQIKGCYA